MIMLSRLPKRFPALSLLLALALAPASALADDPPEIQLQRAMDQPVTLSLQNMALPEAFKQIAATAKVDLKVDATCYELLPYGETTRVTVDFKQSRLREALDVMLIPMSLQTTIINNTIMIRPTAPLQRIGHRADWEELKLLKELWSSADLKMPANGPFNLADAIRAAMESRKELQVSTVADGGILTPAQEHAVEQVGKQLPMSAYRALELYCQLTGNVWFVEAGELSGGSTGGRVVLMTPRQWVNRQLGKPIKITHNQEPLEVVVSDLSHASGIHFVPEPGLYQSVPVVSLSSDNATVLRTLETLAGFTRIAFEVRDDSIYLRLTPGAGQSAPDAIIGRISVPAGDGTFIDYYIHESDLSGEQNELRKKKIEEAVKNMQKAFTTPPNPTPAATGPAPAPATAPATSQP